jgi:uncharacterized membrane protein
VIGLISGGAAGTLHGAALRGRLAAAVGSGRPATYVENAAAIVLGFVSGGLAA